MPDITILLHTSKTMRSPVWDGEAPSIPALLDKTKMLAGYLKTLSSVQLQTTMHVSAPLAAQTHATLAAWNTKAGNQSFAIDSFVGDIYSGLRASTLSPQERVYANSHLRILSGLYGILRPNDGIRPYRLEMGYRLPAGPYRNLYTFWGNTIAGCMPENGLVVNLAAAEYSKAVLPFINGSRVVSPKFLTVDAKTNEPMFVVVHAKIARGAFARWLITTRAATADALQAFNDIGYAYDAALSTPAEPAFVCQEFGGKGLSMRLATK